ncbi:GNAT family N-acetyltransferase [Saccharothrix sp. Mg75]|uniref:GNAT family N-acetyltransferase n=1 Tax=Saccharothrix sp. Mg75 TaxID=3445357 RepID=UPI003EE933CE
MDQDGLVPYLAPPTLPAGALRDRDQPRLDVDDRLVLRPWHEGDAAAVTEAFDCPDIRRWHLRRMNSPEEARAWTRGWSTRWNVETDASWAVADRRTDEPLGQVGLRTVSLHEGVAQLSYWVLPAHRGRAVAVRATRTVERWVFDDLGLRRLFLQHSTANAPSCRVAAKLGFALEGTLRAALVHLDGPHDLHCHAKLSTDPR